MMFNKNLKNILLVIFATLILSACSTAKKSGNIDGDVYTGKETVKFLASGVPDRIFFATNKSSLTTAARETLRKQATYLRKNKSLRMKKSQKRQFKKNPQITHRLLLKKKRNIEREIKSLEAASLVDAVTPLSNLSLKVDQGKPIILICRTGRRTRIIAEMMDKKLGYMVYNAKNGITSWIDAKLPTAKPEY